MLDCRARRGPGVNVCTGLCGGAVKYLSSVCLSVCLLGA